MNKPKLSKEQIQKIVLSAIGFVALIYVYLNFFLAPLAKSRESMEKTIADLQGKIAASKTEIPKADNLEKQATTATTRYAAFDALSPEGAPIAWFPPRMKLFLANQKIDKATIKMDSNTVYAQPELAHWSRYVWQLDLPQTDYATVGKAIAQLENTEPLMTINRLTMHAGSDDPQYQAVSLTVSQAILQR
ncbi:MAG: hypothetical protein M3Y86_04085 [Verrucomicrobiota bacterium]|nr:hypothetical protein [Verrucomicrobiota bacterium]